MYIKIDCFLMAVEQSYLDHEFSLNQNVIFMAKLSIGIHNKSLTDPIFAHNWVKESFGSIFWRNQ